MHYHIVIIFHIVIITQAHPFPRKPHLTQPNPEVIINSYYSTGWAGLGMPEWSAPNYLGQSVGADKKACKNQCRWARGAQHHNFADAVLFDGQPMNGNGYLYLRNPKQIPEKRVNQLWLDFGFETYDYFPILQEPLYYVHIDANMTYRNDSPLHITFMCEWGNVKFLDEYKQKSETPKSKNIAFVASNCASGGAHCRTSYVSELMNYIHVDSLGRCLNNKIIPGEENIKSHYYDHGKSMRNKVDIFKDYRFVLAFENNNITDYVTEKVMIALLAQSLPIYMGAPNIDEFVPENSVIKTDDFDGPYELAKYLMYLIQNEKEYQKFFEWRKKPLPQHVIDKIDKCVFYGSDCRACNFVHNYIKQSGPVIRVKECKSIKLEVGSGITINKKLILKDKFTIALWILIDPNLNQSTSLIYKYDSYKFGLFLHEGNFYLQFCLLERCLIGTRLVRKGAWNHIALVYDATIPNGVQFFVNGVSDYNHNAFNQYISETSNSTEIGISDFFGEIDNLSMWSKPLPQILIQKLSLQMLAGDEEDLLLYYPFNANFGGTLVGDASKNEAHGQIFGTLTYVDSPTKPLYLSGYD